MKVRLRDFVAGFTASLLAGAAALLLHFVYQLPTSDYRTRVYLMLARPPFTAVLWYAGVLLVVGVVASWIAGHRGRYAFIGVVAATIINIALLLNGVFSRTVWLHESDITRTGIAVRTLIAIAGLVVAVTLPRAFTLPDDDDNGPPDYERVRAERP